MILNMSMITFNTSWSWTCQWLHLTLHDPKHVNDYISHAEIILTFLYKFHFLIRMWIRQNFVQLLLGFFFLVSFLMFSLLSQASTQYPDYLFIYLFTLLPHPWKHHILCEWKELFFLPEFRNFFLSTANVFRIFFEYSKCI
jgi:hypothetical protein